MPTASAPRPRPNGRPRSRGSPLAQGQVGPFPLTALIGYAANLREQARAEHGRRLLWLVGEPTLVRTQALELVDNLALEQVVWLGRHAPHGFRAMPSGQYQAILGQDVGHVIVDAWDGFDPDALAGLAGAIGAGGLLLLLTPPPDRWPAVGDPEHARVAVWPWRPEAIPGRFLIRATRLLCELGVPPQPITQRPLARPSPPPMPVTPRPGRRAKKPVAPTPEQQAIMDWAAAVAGGADTRTLVVTAGRGHGKSTALGLAGAAWASSGVQVNLTAPRHDAVQRLLQTASAHRDASAIAPGRLRIGSGGLAFSAPDALAAAPETGTPMLIDEAAALPLPLLERLLQRAGPALIATTTDGYEGSARAATLRLPTILDRLRPGWEQRTLTRGLRYAAGDSLEQIMRALFLLDAEATVPPGIGPAHIERIDQERLGRDEPLLRAVMGLLNHAHYRSRPRDLRYLLDGPNLELWVARLGDGVTGVALIAAEGGFSRDLAQAIVARTRRPRGHLLVQDLATRYREPVLAQTHALRVVRLAVHPLRRRAGIARSLLSAAAGDAMRAHPPAFIGASFGEDPDLETFWTRCGFQLVGRGTRRNAASGRRAAVVAKALTKAGERLLAPLMDSQTRTPGDDALGQSH